MSASNTPVPSTFKELLRHKLKPHNTKILAVGLLVDSLVGIMALYSANPPFDPVIYGAISAAVKALNVGLLFLRKTIQEDEPDAAAQ